VPYDVGLAAVERLRPLVPGGASMAQLALRWILMFEGVTCAIPGARTVQQAVDNTRAGNMTPLGAPVLQTVLEVYDDMIRPHVHANW
jgi:aryl-alcohol dehydrogenase-like predicted oxidoreductase